MRFDRVIIQKFVILRQLHRDNKARGLLPSTVLDGESETNSIRSPGTVRIFVGIFDRRGDR